MAGIYLHIPFCKSRCLYCDFYSTTMLDKREEYCSCLIRELSLRADDFRSQFAIQHTPLTTIYFGGGTPSTLCENSIKEILYSIRKILPDYSTSIEEVTMEANPGDLTEQKLERLRAAGVNRLSIGVQSFSDSLLRSIGRRHTSQEAIEAIQVARKAGFDNISIDLMYGLPNQTFQDWQKDVEKALELNVEHLSAYCLTYEEGTPLYQLLQKGQVAELDDDTNNRMQDYLEEELEKNGLIRYEISNYAKDGFRSKHNSSYWTGEPYLGLGAGAHSYDGANCRSWNPDDIDRYMVAIEQDELPLEQEHLTAQDRYNEAIMLGLRTREGLALERFSPSEKSTILHQAAQFLHEGLLTADQHHLRATHAGTRVLNRIIETLMK